MYLDRGTRADEFVTIGNALIRSLAATKGSADAWRDQKKKSAARFRTPIRLSMRSPMCEYCRRCRVRDAIGLGHFFFRVITKLIFMDNKLYFHSKACLRFFWSEDFSFILWVIHNMSKSTGNFLFLVQKVVDVFSRGLWDLFFFLNFRPLPVIKSVVNTENGNTYFFTAILMISRMWTLCLDLKKKKQFTFFYNCDGFEFSCTIHWLESVVLELKYCWLIFLPNNNKKNENRFEKICHRVI